MTVLIVGAGPTGLTLACELARRGVACRVVDKAPELFIGSRGKGLQPRTLEVFEDLGVLDAVHAGGEPFPKFRLYQGKEVVWERAVHEMLGTPEPTASPTVPYPSPWLIPQWRTDEILRDRFVELGGQLEFGTEVLGFEQDADGVLAHTNRGEIRASYLVGTDGGRSTVRKALGVGFAGETFQTERTLVGDVRADGLDGRFCHILTDAGDITKRFSLWNLPGSEHYQFVASMATEAVPELSLEGVRSLLHERTGRSDVHLHDLRWISLYQVNVRMADRFRVGRVLLAGDAAHVHSAASGQGLNTSVQDAYNLGWKLASVLGGADESLLDSYEAERMPVAAHVLGLSTLLHQRNFRSGPAPSIHQLDVTYRGGPLAVDDRADPGELRAGDRAPDGLLPDGTRLFDAFRGPHATVLAFGGTRETFAVPTVSLAPCEGYDVTEGTLVLVRPDGYIGAISSSAEVIRRHPAATC
ncbi:FAD-dependent monooxygenase [Kutzneria viridogrisea]|uniref:2-polyprenyl-6-methoxyphenol hydroxylase-like FAD-dependent oxidoreductase n=1 Tax=Kutzneria viridogrisea TaxID=47990 RepID=A0ABR6BDJ0_9PSEU|nr:2-polyprenyl-6-methoxyphenol hydroxylase-like FAD-dependent oxidoreductase [Kutzneria viridogrisea]